VLFGSLTQKVYVDFEEAGYAHGLLSSLGLAVYRFTVCIRSNS
jgi:hypothetical protein